MNARLESVYATVVLALVLGTVARTAGAEWTFITFDDLPATTSAAVPHGYNGLTWYSFHYLDPVLTYGSHLNGYQVGMVSPSNVAYNSGGSSASIASNSPFNFASAYLTAAWNDHMQVEAIGYAGASLIYDNTYLLSATVPTLINFNYWGVTAVSFNPIAAHLARATTAQAINSYWTT